ncbi:MAG TPA: F0F1 ATP synthase subunit A [Bryobacteraceae bacterium]|nr:F0F1 ATP synthase subunit A [Bryobacteraceae bacterium]
MQEHEVDLWFTKLFNDFLAAPANAVLNAIGKPAADPAHPWPNWFAMEVLVVLIIMLLFGYLKARLSADRPGKLQLTFEAIYQFIAGQAHDAVEHGSKQYVPFFGALFIFILFMNLIGVIPGFESPTMTPAVPCALAVCVFLYYHFMGFRELGPGKYLLHFAGPVWWLAPIMIPIELISHLARPLSLTIRLFANMFAGEKVTLTFLSLTYLLIPAVFMGLHVFVAFLQAFIFMLLAMIYVGGAVAHEH